MPMKIVKDSIAKAELMAMAQEQFGDFLKAVVDVEQEIMAVGGELHADEEAALIEQGSHQQHLWGINIYPAKSDSEWIEFDSIINIRPSQKNTSRMVENVEVRKRIAEIVRQLISP